MNPMFEKHFTAFVGIDWADSKHDVCIQPAESLQREFSRLPHQVDDIEHWAQSLHKRFSGPIAVTIELSKGPIVVDLHSILIQCLYSILNQPCQKNGQ